MCVCVCDYVCYYMCMCMCMCVYLCSFFRCRIFIKVLFILSDFLFFYSFIFLFYTQSWTFEPKHSAENSELHETGSGFCPLESFSQRVDLPQVNATSNRYIRKIRGISTDQKYEVFLLTKHMWYFY